MPRAIDLNDPTRCPACGDDLVGHVHQDGESWSTCQQGHLWRVVVIQHGAGGEVERLKGLLDRDRTGLAHALNQVRQAVSGWWWVAAGEWGSYEYDARTERALRSEVRQCFESVEKIAADALAASGVRADAAFRPEKDEIAALRADVARLRLELDWERQRSELLKGQAFGLDTPREDRSDDRA